MKEEGKKWKDDREADVLNGLARLGDHLGGNTDPLHAAAKGEAEKDGEGGEDYGQDEPEGGAAHDHLDEAFPGGQEDIVLLFRNLEQSLVAIVGVEGKNDGEADGAEEKREPDSWFCTAGEEENPGEREKE